MNEEIEFNFERIAWGVVHNAWPREPGQELRWSCVSRMTGLGSTYSIALCRKFGADPHQMVGERLMHCDHCGVDYPQSQWEQAGDECPACGREYGNAPAREDDGVPLDPMARGKA